MSLLYIIDAYNLTNHPAFKPVSRSTLNIQHALADFIKFHKLTGSKNNRLVLVFDGYSPAQEDVPHEPGLLCMFSRAQEADEIIKKIIEASAAPKNIVVVSDDRQVQITSRFLQAQICNVQDFICSKQKKQSLGTAELAEQDPKLSYVKMQKINTELRKRWL